VIRLPRIANFDDFDPLRAEPGARVRYVERVDDLVRPDLAVIPGTKTTMADLVWLRGRGLADRLTELAGDGVPILGICGGFQMLGRRIDDPEASESSVASMDGLGLLPVTTTFEPVKRTVRIEGRLLPSTGPLEAAAGSVVAAYEIHMGRSLADRSIQPLVRIERRSGEPVDELDGAVSSDGLILGTYLHGLFDNDRLRHALIDWLVARRQGGVNRPGIAQRHQAAPERARQLDRLAGVVRQNLDLRPLLAACGIT
jgi:adenosylcobyric acid synthase